MKIQISNTGNRRLLFGMALVFGFTGQTQLSEIANHIPGGTHEVGRIARVRRFLAIHTSGFPTWI